MQSRLPSALLLCVTLIGTCLLLSTWAAAQEGQQCTGNPNQLINYGSLTLCSLDIGGSNTFEFNGTLGERVEIVANSLVTVACIELVGVKTACGPGNRNWIDTVLPQTRQYTIRVYDYLYYQGGAYTLALERVAPPSLSARQTTYGKYLSDELNPIGDIDLFFFTASVGDVAHITADSTKTVACIVVYAPDAVATWSACGPGNRNEITTPALTQSGTYTILVFDYATTQGGAYTLDLACLAGPCVVTQIPDVSGYIQLRGSPLARRLVGLQQPGEIGPVLTITDQNGYYQYMHLVPGKNFTVYVLGPVVGDLDSEGKVHLDPTQ